MRPEPDKKTTVVVPFDANKTSLVLSNVVDWARMNIEEENLSSVEAVKEQLPAIMGKIMALCWVNNKFEKYFVANPATCLDQLGISLPASIVITPQKSKTNRPSITVYEQREGSRFKNRLFSLSLTLMATRQGLFFLIMPVHFSNNTLEYFCDHFMFLSVVSIAWRV